MVKMSLKEQLIACDAIRFGDFILASGRKSSVYIDIKKAITDPVILTSIADEVMKKDLDWDMAAGVAVGGVPLAVSVSLRSQKPYVIIRKEQKEHGLSGLIIGDVSGKKILLIEDVTTSGGSALFGIKQIRDAGGIIDSIISVVDRKEGADEAFREAGIRLIPLVTMDDLLS